MTVLPGRTYLYFAAQSINLTAAVMSVTMAAIVGSALAPLVGLSTVPYGCQFLFLMLATYPASMLMSRMGRRKAFMLGSIPLVISGLCGFWAVESRQFALLVVSHAALGVYIAFANFNRFAATDDLLPYLKPKAISLVVAGGIIAAIVGPMLTEILRAVGGFALFSLCYASFTGLAVLSLIIAFYLPAAGRERAGDKAEPLPAHHQNFKPSARATLTVAIVVAALGYGIMNLLMIQASIHMKYMHEDFSDIRFAIQWHVIAMFAPSFFTGVIIQRLGVRATICAGLLLLIACASINMISDSYEVMTVSLVILGLGWNLTYVGGGSLLTEALQGGTGAIRVQGINDLGIAIFATIGAFMPSILLDTVGWVGTNVICLAICMLLLLVVVRLWIIQRHSIHPDGKSAN